MSLFLALNPYRIHDVDSPDPVRGRTVGIGSLEPFNLNFIVPRRVSWPFAFSFNVGELSFTPIRPHRMWSLASCVRLAARRLSLSQTNGAATVWRSPLAARSRPVFEPRNPARAGFPGQDRHRNLESWFSRPTFDHAVESSNDHRQPHRLAHFKWISAWLLCSSPS